MFNAILGKKIKMDQAYVGETRVPVTRVLAGPCVVSHVKSEDKDGYWAVQMGFGERRLKNVTKPVQGHLKGAIKENKAPFFVREVRQEARPEVAVGDTIALSDVLRKGDTVSVTSKSKGKGFAGVVRRWKFAGGPKTHGQSNRQRSPGSIGQGTTPGRVRKGKKMGGRMGFDTVTIKNLRVIDIDKDKSELVLSGSIPGHMGTLLIIKRLAHGSVDELEEKAPEVVAQVEEEEGTEPKAAPESAKEPKAEEVRE